MKQFLTLCALLAASVLAWAQGQGKISGRVNAESGAPVPNAVVIITNNSGGPSQRVLSAADGTFTVMNLAPGSYRVEVESAGFQRATQADLQITPANTFFMVVKLVPGSGTDKVAVHARAPLINTESGEIARPYDGRIFRELPVHDRQIQEFISLMPGVTPSLTITNPILEPQRNRVWNTNGQMAAANYRMYDGVSNQEPFTGTTHHVPSLEAARDLEVRTSNYSADFGRAGGSISGITSRPGTNGFHGTFYEFFSPGRFHSFNLQPNPKPHYVSNQFGGSLGFPIAPDKVFLFLNYEGNLLRQGVTTVSTVPTAEFRAGNLSASPGITLFDPRSGNATTGSGRVVFVNNTIPSTAINPLSASILSALPLPNQPGLINNYVTNVPYRNDMHRPTGRLDWRLSDSTYLFLRYGQSHGYVMQPSALGAIGSGAETRLRNHSAVFDLTHSLSPSLTADLRLGFNRYSNAPNPTGFNGFSLPASVEAAFPNGLPSIQVTGLEPLGWSPNIPSRNLSNNWNLVNNWSAISGRHNLKLGFDAWWIRGEGFQNMGFGQRGTFGFTPGGTLLPGSFSLAPVGTFSNAFASFLLGSPTQIGQTLPVASPRVANLQMAGYIADRVQVTRMLSLDIGLRYELFSPLRLRETSGFMMYNPLTNQIAPFTSDMDRYGNMRWNYNNWAPRFGFAARMSERTALRGAYAISYWNPPLMMDTGIFAAGTDGFQRGIPNGFGVAGTFSLPQPIAAPNGFAPNMNFTAFPGRLKTPSVQSFHLTLQHDIGWGAVVDVGYVGNLGRHLPYIREMNAALPGTGLGGLPFNNAAFGFRTASTLERDNALNSNYNSLQANLTKRFSHNFSFTAAYTWGKSLDYGNGIDPMLNPFNRRANYGPSDWDRRQMFTLSHLFQSPIKGGLIGTILGAWQLSGVYRFAGGNPFTPTSDPTFCACPGVTPTADVIVAGTQTVFQPYYSPFYYGYGFGFVPYEVPLFAFTDPGPGRLGNVGRNSVRGPNLSNYNASLFRIFPAGEKFKLELRGEVYNVTNRTHFATPIGNVSSMQFGQSTALMSGYGPRAFQFAGRVVF